MTYRPRLVAVNRFGQHFTVFAVPNLEEANDKRRRLERELDEMTIDAWCDRYVVPAGFVEGSWRPGQLGHEASYDDSLPGIGSRLVRGDLAGQRTETRRADRLYVKRRDWRSSAL